MKRHSRLLTKRSCASALGLANFLGSVTARAVRDHLQKTTAKAIRVVSLTFAFIWGLWGLIVNVLKCTFCDFFFF